MLARAPSSSSVRYGLGRVPWNTLPLKRSEWLGDAMQHLLTDMPFPTESIAATIDSSDHVFRLAYWQRHGCVLTAGVDSAPFLRLGRGLFSI